MRGYTLVTGDLVQRGKLKPDVLCDLGEAPFKHFAFDFLIADLPFPWKQGKRYGGVSSLTEFGDLLWRLRISAYRIVKGGGIVILKATDIERKGEVYPGIYHIHKVMGSPPLKLIDIIITHFKPFRYLSPRMKRSAQIHNYLMVYERERQCKLEV